MTVRQVVTYSCDGCRRQIRAACNGPIHPDSAWVWSEDTRPWQFAVEFGDALCPACVSLYADDAEPG